jgi:hypothetical protein
MPKVNRLLLVTVMESGSRVLRRRGGAILELVFQSLEVGRCFMSDLDCKKRHDHPRLSSERTSSVHVSCVA